MGYEALVEKKEVASAFAKLRRTLEGDGDALTRSIGWQGGHKVERVVWHHEHGIWTAAFDDDQNRLYCWVGTQDPHHASTLRITCEINTPREGSSRRVKGRLVRGDDGLLYLAHSGGIGGGRPGIGTRLFRQHYANPSAWARVRLGGREHDYVIVGRVGPDLLPNLALFAKEVDRIKALASRRKDPSPAPPPARDWGERTVREFAGRRRAYRIAGLIQGDATHGWVVNALQDALRSRGARIGSNRSVDTYVIGRRKRLVALLEIKTDTSSESLYKAVGQLYINQVRSPGANRLVAVFPDSLGKQEEDLLGSLNVLLVRYARRGRDFIFSGLDKVP